MRERIYGCTWLPAQAPAARAPIWIARPPPRSAAGPPSLSAPACYVSRSSELCTPPPRPRLLRRRGREPNTLLLPIQDSPREQARLVPPFWPAKTGPYPFSTTPIHRKAKPARRLRFPSLRLPSKPPQNPPTPAADERRHGAGAGAAAAPPSSPPRHAPAPILQLLALPRDSHLHL